MVEFCKRPMFVAGWICPIHFRSNGLAREPAQFVPGVKDAQQYCAPFAGHEAPVSAWLPAKARSSIDRRQAGLPERPRKWLCGWIAQCASGWRKSRPIQPSRAAAGRESRPGCVCRQANGRMDTNETRTLQELTTELKAMDEILW